MTCSHWNSVPFKKFQNTQLSKYSNFKHSEIDMDAIQYLFFVSWKIYYHKWRDLMFVNYLWPFMIWYISLGGRQKKIQAFYNGDTHLRLIFSCPWFGEGVFASNILFQIFLILIKCWVMFSLNFRGCPYIMICNHG